MGRGAETTVEELVGTGDHVLVIACFQGGRRGSGVSVAERLYEVYAWRSGSVLRVGEFSDRAEAVEAVGLGQQAMSRENVGFRSRATPELARSGRNA